MNWAINKPCLFHKIEAILITSQSKYENKIVDECLCHGVCFLVAPASDKKNTSLLVKAHFP